MSARRTVTLLPQRRFASVGFQPQQQSFHKRPLPPNLIALSSPEGKQIFKEALQDGGMECYFPLAEQFVTQSEPSYCSVSSLAMVLNALNFDPKRIWKGAWRWVSEDMLSCESKSVCGHSLERIKKDGLSFHDFESLARCHGVRIQSFRVCHGLDENCGAKSYEVFKQHIIHTTRSDHAKSFTVVNYSRKYLHQTGDGHYSPIGGYHRERDLALILDVARFKYPPYWVKLSDLWNSMALQDQVTGQTRGYFVISAWDDDQIVSAKQAEDSAVATGRESCPHTIRTWDEMKKLRVYGHKSEHDQHRHGHDHSCCSKSARQ
jgi:glutathione gamma-glutamylcysteinyltransferase